MLIWNRNYSTWYAARLSEGAIVLGKSCSVLLQASFTVNGSSMEPQVGAQWFMAPSSDEEFKTKLNSIQNLFIAYLIQPSGWTGVSIHLHLVSPRLFLFALTPKIGTTSTTVQGYYNQMSLVEPKDWKINFGACYGAGVSRDLSGLIPEDIQIVPIYMRYSTSSRFLYKYTTEGV